MELEKCKLYGIKRKRNLFYLLGIKDKAELRNIVNKYTPYIGKDKKRLIEPANNPKLKKVQKRIQILLKDIIIDENVFSGVSGKSYIDNGKFHIGCKYVVALDISKFFPNTCREKIYSFFKSDLCVSSDVAKILTDLCTIDLSRIDKVDKEINTYIKDKKIKSINHLPTGSSISCLLSYLVNYEMFKNITQMATESECKLSIYVDDIVISSDKKINKQLIDRIISIINNNGYKIQRSKLKFYNSNEFKRITGNVLSKNGGILVIPNKIRYKIIKTRKNKELKESKKVNRIKGLQQVIEEIKKANKV